MVCRLCLVWASELKDSSCVLCCGHACEAARSKAISDFDGGFEREYEPVHLLDLKRWLRTVAQHPGE